jgi:hypothetical protein
MKTITKTTTYYLYDELPEQLKSRAVYNFKMSKVYQYAYAYSDQKVIELIRKGEYYFDHFGELSTV